jgi:superfamily I DNA/RNA helicase
MIDPASKLPMTHDGYLKMWAMEKPQIDGDFILLDEAQDTNGVVMELMRHQGAQLITVGDKWQSIYRWRGAMNAMVELPTEIERRLSTSFRFGPNIAGFATGILAMLGETLPLTGNPEKTDSLEIIANPRAILARTNARLIEELVGQLEAGKRPFIVGGVAEMLTLLDATEKLQAGMTVDNPLMFFGYKNWAEVRIAAQDEDNRELSGWVNLVEKYGVDALKDAFEGLPKDEKKADVVLSTGHKSKGREWGEVKLCEDFLIGVSKKEDPEKGEKPIPTDELMLFYVAATRGQEKLDVHPDLTSKLDALKKRAAADVKEAAE